MVEETEAFSEMVNITHCVARFIDHDSLIRRAVFPIGYSFPYISIDNI